MITDLNEIQFPKLGLTFHIDPTAFTIFGVSIQWYGLFITLGLALAMLYCYPKMKRFGIDADRATDAVIGGLIGGLIGARLYYVIMKWSEFKKDSFKDTLIEVINIRTGGLAIYGGLIGALAVGLIICKIRKVKILPMLDVAVIGFLIGQGIGRWGNFVNQEAFGTNTSSIFGMTGGRIQLAISSGMQMGNDMYNNGLSVAFEEPVHPCFLYESIWCLLGFVLLAFWSKRRKYDGQIFLMYMSWYGLERFFVEGLRTDSLMVGSIRISQALSAVIFVASVIIQIVMFFRVKRDPESYVLYASTEESRQLIEESRRKAMGLNDPIMHSHMEDDDGIGILPDEDDDDDEIGILPDEEDDDEIGELPDEEDEDDDENDDDDDTDEADDEEVEDDADDDADNDAEEEDEQDEADGSPETDEKGETGGSDSGNDDEADEEPAGDAPADTAGDDASPESADAEESADEGRQESSEAGEVEESPAEEDNGEDDPEYDTAVKNSKPDNSYRKSKKGKRRR